MTQDQTPKRIHPLIAIAAVSIILVSLVGVAAITGIIPNSSSTTSPANSLAADKANKEGNSPEMNAQSAANTADTRSDAEARPSPQSNSNHKVASHTTSNANSATSRRNEDDNNAPVNNSQAQAPAICDSCGVVESVRTVEHQAQQGSGLGAAAGAILGGVLGHQVGGGNGNKLATVAGAVGGGFAGNEIEKRKNTSTSYEVRVRMENGNTRTFTPSSQPDWRAGDRVKVINGNLTFR